jgi:hypothetical protein
VKVNGLESGVAKFVSDAGSLSDKTTTPRLNVAIPEFLSSFRKAVKHHNQLAIYLQLSRKAVLFWARAQ